MERYVETLFRHKWLLLFLLIVIPTLGTGYAFDHRQVLYQASATVWAERPAYLSTIGDWNQWSSPAQNQTANVQEMLQTDRFDLEVIAQTDLRQYLLSENERTQMINDFRKRYAVSPIGTHLLTVSYSDERPQVAVQVVTAIINSFNKEMLQNANAQSAQALGFYEKQLVDANTELAQATAALDAYLKVHPDLTQPIKPGQSEVQLTPLVADAAFAAQHPDLIKLVNDRTDAVKQQQTLASQITQIEFQQGSNSAGADETFRVMDAAVPPNKPLSVLRKFALEIGLSLAVALGLAVAGLLVLTLLDTTLRSATTAAARLHLPVLATVPVLRARRGLLFRRRFRRRGVRGLLALNSRALTLGELG